MAKYLTPRQLAAELQLSIYTVLGLAREGKIPEIRVSRNIHRFELDAVVAAIKKRMEEQPAKSKVRGK